MVIKLDSDVIVNTDYVTAIEPYNYNVVNNNDNPIKYILHMVDGRQWYMTVQDKTKIVFALKGEKYDI